MKGSLYHNKYLAKRKDFYHEDEQKQEIITVVVEAQKDAMMWKHLFKVLESDKYSFQIKLPFQIEDVGSSTTGCQWARNLTDEEKKSRFGHYLIVLLDSDYRLLLSHINQRPFQPVSNYIYETYIHSLENFAYHPTTLKNYFEFQNPTLSSDDFNIITDLISPIANSLYQPLLLDIFIQRDPNKTDTFSISSDLKNCLTPLQEINVKTRKQEIATQVVTDSQFNSTQISEFLEAINNLTTYVQNQVKKLHETGQYENYLIFKERCNTDITHNDDAICFLEGHYYEGLLNPIINLIIEIYKEKIKASFPTRVHTEVNKAKSSQVQLSDLYAYIKYQNIPFFTKTLNHLQDEYNKTVK